MLRIAEYLLTATLIVIVAAFVLNLVVLSAGRRTTRRRVVRRPVSVGAAHPEADAGVDEDGEPLEVSAVVAADPQGESDDVVDEADDRQDAPPPAKPAPRASDIGTLATGLTVVALLLLTGYIGIRMSLTGHGPFTNQHEFAVSFVWGILAAYLVALWRFKVRLISLVILPVAGCLTLYAIELGYDMNPVVPALQNNLLLTLHVGFAMLAYGAACVSFGAAILWLIHPKLHLKTTRDKLDEIGYKAAVVTFPLLTIMILLGALWANTAWGRYWGWDPKETAALVTWLLYGAFLHARVVRGWRGQRAAWLLIIGFAAVMFAYFGNYFFGGLHSYK